MPDTQREQGRKQDLITLAEKVCGWHVQPHFDPEPMDTRTICWCDGHAVYAREYVAGRCVRTIQFDPFNDLLKAWMLVEALRKRFTRVELHAVGVGINSPNFVCIVEDGVELATEHADTAPLAICAAALQVAERMEGSHD